MKLHQIAKQSKLSFVAISYLNQIYSNLSIDGESFVQKTEQNNNKILRLPLFDRTGRLQSLVMDTANICILGDNPCHTLDLSLHIQAYYAGKSRLAKIINIKQYSNLLSSERNNPNFIYVVKGSSADVSTVTLTAILTQFSNIFVFPLAGIKLACSYSGKIHATARFNEISIALGGNHHLRRYFLASLQDDEFLAITGNKETIRTLNQNKVAL